MSTIRMAESALPPSDAPVSSEFLLVVFLESTSSQLTERRSLQWCFECGGSIYSGVAVSSRWLNCEMTLRLLVEPGVCWMFVGDTESPTMEGASQLAEATYLASS
jgi:hypothetical protein